MAEAKITRVKVKCVDCGKDFEISYSGYTASKRLGRPFRCKECGKKYRAKMMAERMANMSQEEKEAMYKKAGANSSAKWKQMTQEEKAKRMEAVNAGSAKWRETVSEEEKQRISKIHTESNIRRWEAMSEEEKRRASEEGKRRWAAMSQEEKDAHAQRSREMWGRMTPEQRAAVQAKMSANKTAFWQEISEEDRTALGNKIGDGLRAYWAGLSSEERSQISEQRRMEWDALPEEERLRRRQLISQSLREWWADIPEEVKTERALQLSEGREAWEQSLTMAQRNQRMLANSQNAKVWWNGLSDADLAEISAKRIEAWNRKTPEEKLARAQLSSNIASAWWASLTEEERADKIARLQSVYREWFDGLTDEQLATRSQNVSAGLKKFWDSMRPEERLLKTETAKHAYESWWNKLSVDEQKSFIRKRFVGGIGKNQFHQRFEKAFSASHISNSFSYVPETVMITNGISHSWDYGIYDGNGNLVMLVDLDGAFYHADNCDYNGLHSKEEADAERAQSLPPGVKHFIIQELNFYQCFDQMIRFLMENYDEYVDDIFHQLRSIPFPYPKYADVELCKSFFGLQNMDCNSEYYSSISSGTRMGDRLIQHFHPSIWHARRGNHLSPYEAWQDDGMLRKCIQNRIVYQCVLNPNKILQGFSISKAAPKVSVFSAGRARMIIHQYLSSYSEVFDPFSGFSGRMLGAISLGKEYVGQDVSSTHVQESNQLIDFLSQSGFDVHARVEQRDILNSSGSYPCLFTCPPYGLKEQWMDVAPSDRSCDMWIQECLQRFQCKRYVFVVDRTEKFRSYIKAAINNRSHFGSSNEYILVID